MNPNLLLLVIACALAALLGAAVSYGIDAMLAPLARGLHAPTSYAVVLDLEPGRR
jgi:hypothetical protein